MKGLAVFYFVLMIVCLPERSPGRALYWLGAGLITVAVITGMR
jgi:hypothetical protein